MIHHPQAPQMAKQLTIRGNIKHNLLFSALREILSGISRKMRERREGAGIWKYDQARNICVITGGPWGPFSLTWRQDSGYFTNFLSWLQTLDVPGADASDVESHYHQDSSGRQHTHTQMFSHKGSNFYRQNGIYFKVPWSDRKWNKWFSNMQISIEAFYSIPLTTSVVYLSSFYVSTLTSTQPEIHY